MEVELAAQKAAEAATVAVAQRASAEINALKTAITELEKKFQQAAQAAPASEAMEELAEKFDALATTVRAVVADADEVASTVAKGQADAKQALESELKSVREEIKKSAKQAEKNADKMGDDIESIRTELRHVRANPLAAEAPSAPAVVAKKVEETVQPKLTEGAEEAEPIDEIFEEIEAPEEVSMPAVAAGTGTALIINLMIGIGNKPYVRGTGPGLSPDKGVLMNFLGIGRWQWISPDPEAPATVEVWKNDQSPMGEPLHLSGGEPVEVDEGHFGA